MTVICCWIKLLFATTISTFHNPCVIFLKHRAHSLIYVPQMRWKDPNPCYACRAHQTISYFIQYTYPDTATPDAVTRNSPRALAKCYTIHHHWELCSYSTPIPGKKLQKKIHFSAPSVLKKEMKASEWLNISHGFQWQKNPIKTVGNYWEPCKIDAGAKISPKRGGHCSTVTKAHPNRQLSVVRQYLDTSQGNPWYCKEVNIVVEHVN